MDEKPTPGGEAAPGDSARPRPSRRLDLTDGPTRYVDRPGNEGKHGDAADEPNEGFPRQPDSAEKRPNR